MIENRNGTNKSMEKALKNYDQAKQRVANEKKQNEKKRKAEPPHNPLSPMSIYA